MDANINIFEAPNRTESKPSSKRDAKAQTDGAFASTLADTNQTDKPSKPSQQNEAVSFSIETNAQETGSQSANHSGAASTNMAGGSSTAGDSNSGTIPNANPIASTAALATSSEVANGNAALAAANTPAKTDMAPQTQAGPGASSSTSNALSSTGAGSQALNQVPTAVAPIVASAQNGGRHLGQLNSTPPGSAESIPAQKPAQTAANPALQSLRGATDGNQPSQEQLQTANAAPGSLAQQKPTGQPHVETSDGAIQGKTNSAEAAANSQTSPQGTAENASAALKPSIDAAPNPNAAAQAINSATKPSNRQTPTTQNKDTARLEQARPTANTNPGGLAMTPNAAGPNAQPLAQPINTADATRPANAAIEGLNPTTNPNTAKKGQTTSGQQSLTQQSQTQTQANQVSAAAQQQSVDAPIQTARTDASLDGFMTMDVDSAPEVLTSAALQERVHNNLPQTTLHLRMAPGQAPAIAPNDLALHIARQVQGGTTRFEIRIDPPEMGRIEVQMDMKSQKPVQAHLFVERSETLDLLQRDARQLERALQNLGIDVDSDSLSFSLRDGNADTAGQNGDQNSAFQTAYQVDEKDNTGDIVIPSDIPTEAYGFQLAATQGVNIQV